MARLRARTLPAEGAPSGWYALLEPPEPARRLRTRVRADCAVLGAGFTGLAAAARLAELRPDWRVVVVEGQRVGLGTSGRNSGFVVDFANNSMWTAPEVRRRAVELNRAGSAHLRARRDELGLGEHWSDAGWLHTAASPRALPGLRRLRGLLEEAGREYDWYDADALAEKLGTPYYHAALRIVGGAMVQPAALVRALAARLPEQVELYERSPAVTVETGRRTRIETVEGEVDADRLVLALNGLSPSLGVLGQRVFPLVTFAAMTRVLTSDEREVLGGDPEWGLIALETTGASVRRTRDHRLYFRATHMYSRDARTHPAMLARAAADMRHLLAERFGELSEVEFEHHWTGILGITRNRLPYFGRLARNVYTAAGYGGAGIAMGVSSGHRLAELAADEETDLLRQMLALPRPGWLPPEPLFGPIARLNLWRISLSAK